MKKTFFGLIFSFAVVCLFCAINCAAAVGGECGQDVYWTVENGTLIISGNGDISSFGFSKEGEAFICKAPWSGYRDEIERIVIGENIRSISDYAFTGMRAVKSVKISSGTGSIGDYAFYACTGLETVSLADGIHSLGSYCFADDVRLTEIRIPKSVSFIGTGFTAGDSSVCRYTADSGNDAYITENGVLFTADSKTLVAFPSMSPEKYVIPEGVETLADFSFSTATLEKLYVPESVIYAGNYAFRLSSIKTIYFEGVSVPQTGKENDGLNNADKRFGCVFGYCGKNAMWTIEERNLSLFGTGKTDKFSSDGEKSDAPWERYPEFFENVFIEDGIDEISAYAFCFMKNIVSVKLGESVSAIGKYAFAFTTIKSITLPAKVSNVSSLAFYRCSYLTEIDVSSGNKTYKSSGGVLYSRDMKILYVYPYGKNSSKIFIPYGVVTVYNAAFIRTAADTVFFPKTVKKICDSAFKYSKIKAANFECAYSEYSSVNIGENNDGLLSAVKTFSVHLHTETLKAVSASCTKTGLTKGKRCLDCGEVIEKQTVIPATGHKVKKIRAVKATQKADGKTASYYCTVCNKTIKSSKPVYRIKSVKLSAGKYAYNGKVHKPSVTVKDKKGNTLKKGTDYKVTYASEKSKAIGTYTVKIVFCKNYSGTVKLTYKINPGKVSGVKVSSPGKKTVKISYGKIPGAEKYAIFYSAAKNGKFKRLTNTGKTAYTYKNLKSGKTYYFKVAAYKTVDGKRIYGSFSAVKTVKIK